MLPGRCRRRVCTPCLPVHGHYNDSQQFVADAMATAVFCAQQGNGQILLDKNNSIGCSNPGMSITSPPQSLYPSFL